MNFNLPIIAGNMDQTNALAKATGIRGAGMDQQRQQATRQALAQYGGAAMRGDPMALNALAASGPVGAETARRMASDRSTAAARAATLQQQQANAARAQENADRGYALDRERFDASVGKPADEYGRYVQEQKALGQTPLSRIEFKAAGRPAGSSVVVGPDGKTTIDLNGGAGIKGDTVGDPTAPKFILDTIDGILNDPALESSTGWKEWMKVIPGSDQKRFSGRVKQLEGQTFLQAFELLKGGGPITDVEGLKGTQAIARIDAAQSPEDFRDAVTEFRDVVTQIQLRRENERTYPEAPPVGGVIEGMEYLGGWPRNEDNWRPVGDTGRVK